MSPTTIKRVVSAYFAATRAMDLEAWLDTFAEDSISYDPVGAPPTQGHRGLRQFWQAVAGAFETFSITEEDIFVAGSSAAVKWHGQGVGKNGRAVSFHGIDVFEVNSQGKIQKMFGYWDPAPVMAELMA
jgi:steroid delta-isomerase